MLGNNSIHIYYTFKFQLDFDCILLDGCFNISILINLHYSSLANVVARTNSPLLSSFEFYPDRLE